MARRLDGVLFPAAGGPLSPGADVINSGIMAQPLLTIFAEAYAKPGKEEALRKVLLGLVAPTKKEAGCVQYDLHVDNDDPRHCFL
jgi:hypothetical protein